MSAKVLTISAHHVSLQGPENLSQDSPRFRPQNRIGDVLQPEAIEALMLSASPHLLPGAKP